MKKLILLTFLAFIFIYGYSQKTLTIGILDEKKNSESDPYLAQLKKEIVSVVGKETNVVFNDVFYNNYDLFKAKENYKYLVNNQVDIIVSFGVVNTIMLNQEAKFLKPTIIVGAINNDFVDLPQNKLNSEINNLTYLVTPFSYKDDLKAFNSVVNFDKIGVVVDSFLLNLLPIKKYFDDYFYDKDSDYKLITLNEQSNIDTMFNSIDAVYLVSKTSISEDAFGDMIRSINLKKLPSLSGYGIRDVEKGVLITNQPANNFDQIYRRIALNIESINNGINASDLPLHINYNKQLSINMNTAEAIGFSIRNRMLFEINLIEGATVGNYGTVYTMVEIMNGVLDSNLALDAEKKNIILSEQDVKSSKSQFLPDITANADGSYLDPKIAEVSNGQNPEFTTTSNVSLSQVVYSEEAAANISIQKSLLASQKENFNANQMDAILNAGIAYYNALILKTNLSIQNKNLQLTKQNLEIANQNLELGASGKSDVLRFKSQLAQNTQGMIEARNSLSQAYYQINQLLNKPITEAIDVKDTFIDNSTNKNADYQYFLRALDDPIEQVKITQFFIDEAKKNAPELKYLGHNLEVVQRQYRLNKNGRFIPTVALQGQYNYTMTKAGAGSEVPVGNPITPDGSYNIGLNLSFPIFQQNTRNINKQIALIQEDQLNIQKEDIELSIDRNINDIVLDLINEIANIEISKVDLEFSEESLELSQNEYQNGAIPVIQLIDAQNNYFKARIANSTAQYNYEIVLLELQRMLGYFFDLNPNSANQDFILRAEEYILNNK